MARNYRLRSWDYKGRGIYMISINVEGRLPLLGTLMGGTAGAWVDYTPLGNAVSEQIEQAFAPYPQIQLCAKQLMPDHLHFVVWVKEAIPVTLGEIIRRMKIGCTHAWWEISPLINERSTDATNGLLSPTGAGSLSSPTGAIDCVNELHIHAQQPSQQPQRPPSLFEPGFHDRVLLHAGQLRNLIGYVHDNPRRLALKRANPDLFRIHQLTQVGGVVCTTLGNLFFAEYPMREALQCSRSLTQAQIDALREECLNSAAHGTIYVCPAISEGEKQICRALREAGFRLIILLSEGFPAPDSEHYRYYKPHGVYFEACAAGQLLLVEPAQAFYEREDVAAYVYSKTGIRDLPHTSKRYRFVAQNAIARLMAYGDIRATTQS